MKSFFTLVFTTLLLSTASFAKENPKVLMQTSMGDVTLELYPDSAPVTVKNFLGYVDDGSYENTIFHRVIKQFMNQGGGFTADFTRKPTRAPIQNEADNGLKNERGTIAMARTNSPHSATNQFFINTANNVFLNHSEKNSRGWGYAVFGRVIDGMEVMNRIEKAPTHINRLRMQDVPVTPIIITRMTHINKTNADSDKSEFKEKLKMTTGKN